MRDDSYLVGGFHGGDWQTMGELVVRWFQFSIFTSITRLHGDRHPSGAQYTGAPLSAECDPTGAAGGAGAQQAETAQQGQAAGAV